MTINEIQDLIKFIAKAGVTEVEIEKKDFKITIKSQMPKRKGEPESVIQVPVAIAPHAAGILPEAPVQVVTPAVIEDESDNYITVKSPMIGTFYHRSAPDKDPFVEV